MSAAAALAINAGYKVDGCDLQEKTPYIEKLINEIDIKLGHSPEHLEGRDILVVTPAVYFTKPVPEEIRNAKTVITWQNFLGSYLANGKKVISIAGTHGKSTTTALLSLVFEKAKKDPSVMVGAKLLSWGTNYRSGKSDLFIVEGDEFYDNFLSYAPDALIINNIEFDHPDYFKNEKAVFLSFKKHIKSLKGKRLLVYNYDSENLRNLVSSLKEENINTISYSLNNREADIYTHIISKDINGTKFEVISNKLNLKYKFAVNLCGDFNVSNALGVIAVSTVYSIKPSVINSVLSRYKGLGRRMELIGKPCGVLVYDDYAHHPTKVRETLKAIRQKHPQSKIIAVIEPHSYSRTKALLNGYKGAFATADRVLIAPIFKARDNSNFGVSEKSIVEVSGHQNITIAGSVRDALNQLTEFVKKGDIVIVMGAGESYKLAEKLVAELKVKTIRKGVSLASYTTFGVGGKVSYFVTLFNQQQLKKEIGFIKRLNLPLIALGGGSNLLVTDKKTKAVILHYVGEGIERLKEDRSKVIIRIEAGTLWDSVVEYAVKHSLAGIECMSGIPGTTGAAPIQNIGAYGQELKDVFVGLTAFDMVSMKFRTFNKEECEFGYRDSIFKNKHKNRFLITSVDLALKKNSLPGLSYSSLADAIEKKGIKKPTLNDVRESVLKIRKEKFGSINGKGTAGSFFKNPIVSKEKLAELQKNYPDVYFNEVNNGFKLFAGWLIEMAGFRGVKRNNVGVSEKNALVITKLNSKARAGEILKLSRDIQKAVKEKFGITIEREVNLLGFKDEELR